MRVALTIAGSDSGGGAGIQADLKTFAALGVHGTSAITCVTAQNPKRVLGIQPCPPEIVRLQIEAVFAELHPTAAKTGMLYSAPIIRVVAECLRRKKPLRLVVDPVMISTSGAALLKETAKRALVDELFPLASLLTPNADEAGALTGRTPRSVEDLRRAAREIHARFGCAVVVKGGHVRGGREAADIFYDGRQELLLTAPFSRGIRTHGTGCTFSAAITAELARCRRLDRAVVAAKDFITKAIAASKRVGCHWVLGS